LACEALAEAGNSSLLPDIEVVELSPADSVQAWAEAQRGARELAERGYFNPTGKLHVARHEAGADVNRVLFVEDDNTTAKVLEFLLAENGFQGVRAATAAAAYAELQASPLPDVVLLDVHLPDADGFDILRHIRSTPALRDLPVVMVTAQISDEDVLIGLKEGADGYIFKPFRWQTLHACIEKVL
ncbi:MAG: response regulator, partial [Proteobacteria bacterium]|nr:response regulator [Pseudomonadota bacterium]